MNTAATRQRRIMPITPPTVDEETSEKAAPVFLPSEIVEVLSDVLTPVVVKEPDGVCDDVVVTYSLLV